MMKPCHVVASVVFVIGMSAMPSQAINLGEILTFDPLTDPVVTAFGVDLNNTQTWTGAQLRDASGNSAPSRRWFKYTADGNSAVTFDTFGTNMSSVGPDPDRCSTCFVTFVNQTQLALYDDSGNLVARIGTTKDINGELVPEFPGVGFDPLDPNHHLANSSVGLSELIFMQNAPGNPHWDTSPGGISDPLSTTPYEGLHINDCPPSVCSGQTYSPDANGIWNEYRVWNETLQGVVDKTLAPWRASDHYNVGPGASWNRYNVLPAGDYYLMLTDGGPSFSGDTFKEEYLMAPWHDGDNNPDPFIEDFVEDVSRIDAPMGPFEMYVGFSGDNDSSQWGDIQLNITHFALTLEGDLDGDGFVGINDLNIVLANWNQNVPPANPLADPSGDGFVGIDDLNAVLGNWNAGTPPTSNAAIPEPASLVLLGLGGLTSLRRRR